MKQVEDMSSADLIDSVLYGRRSRECRAELLARDWTDKQIEAVVAQMRKDMEQ